MIPAVLVEWRLLGLWSVVFSVFLGTQVGCISALLQLSRTWWQVAEF